MWRSIEVILKMSQVVSGWERIARQFLERCRGFSIDEVVDEKRRILEEALPYWLARYLWLLFAYIIFHLKLLHAVTQPIHSFLTEGIKSTVYADGHFRRPRFSFSKIRVEIAVMLLTFSALWHCFSMPNPLGILRWGVTVRPQVNVKPRMVRLRKYIAFLSLY
uniref:Bestrophin homolog n=1 Tax=Parascaris univalens TaxID=6257 RepID=A0A915BK22_PARUN